VVEARTDGGFQIVWQRRTWSEQHLVERGNVRYFERKFAADARHLLFSKPQMECHWLMLLLLLPKKRFCSFAWSSICSNLFRFEISVCWVTTGWNSVQKEFLNEQAKVPGDFFEQLFYAQLLHQIKENKFDVQRHDQGWAIKNAAVSYLTARLPLGNFFQLLSQTIKQCSCD